MHEFIVATIDFSDGHGDFVELAGPETLLPLEPNSPRSATSCGGPLSAGAARFIPNRILRQMESALTTKRVTPISKPKTGAQQLYSAGLPV
jgi:hypothetical protein